MKAKNKSSIFIGILLIIVSISLCCIFGILCTETALADTDIITTQTLNGTEEVRHNMYIGDSNFNESKDFNTGIKFYSRSEEHTSELQSQR